MHANGKGALRKLVSAVVAAGIKAVVVPDFDILQNNGEFRPLIESVGGDFEWLRADAAAVQNYYNAKDPVTAQSLNDVFSDAIKNLPQDVALDANQVRSITQKIRITDRWAQSKHQGIEGLPPTVTVAGKALLAKLKTVGIHIPPVGEMESFIKDVGNLHAYDWLNAVFEQRLHLSPDNIALRQFAKDIVATIEEKGPPVS